MKDLLKGHFELKPLVIAECYHFHRRDPPLALSLHCIIDSAHSLGNVNRLDPVLNVPEPGRQPLDRAVSGLMYVYVPNNLGICAVSKLRSSFSESGNCVPISRLRGTSVQSREYAALVRNLEIAQFLLHARLNPSSFHRVHR